MGVLTANRLAAERKQSPRRDPDDALRLRLLLCERQDLLSPVAPARRTTDTELPAHPLNYIEVGVRPSRHGDLRSRRQVGSHDLKDPNGFEDDAQVARSVLEVIGRADIASSVTPPVAVA